MITILEGPDACGKTTLAQSAAFSDHEYRHQGQFQNDVVAEVLFALRWAPRPVLFDRLHCGEHVYGPIMRGVDMLGEVEDRWLQRVLLAEQAVVIMALPRIELAVAEWQKTRLHREEYVTLEEKYIDVFVAFTHLHTGLPTVSFDWENNTPEQMRERVDNARPPFNEGPGIGHFRPGGTLIVGDRVNPAIPSLMHPYPFVGSSDGRYITQQLINLGVPESSLYWINARDFDGGWLDAGFIDKLQPKRIITIGKSAAMWASGNRLEYRSIPPAGAWKELHGNAPYVPLKEALLAD